jgi:hypothetical protein
MNIRFCSYGVKRIRYNPSNLRGHCRMRHLWLFLTLTLTAPLAAQQGDLYNVIHPTTLRTAPDAKPLGQLYAGTAVEIVAREHGWAKIHLEGWIREADLAPADSALRKALSAADLRADPEGTRGKIVQWTVEFLALQTADPLRRGLADEEPYMLARGPGGENAILYLVIPPSLMNTARALQPLARIAVTARVRDGRSEPAGIPILDVQSIHPPK